MICSLCRVRECQTGVFERNGVVVCGACAMWVLSETARTSAGHAFGPYGLYVRAVRRRPSMLVVCPLCGAGAGVACTTPSGRRVHAHASRKTAASEAFFSSLAGLVRWVAEDEAP